MLTTLISNYGSPTRRQFGVNVQGYRTDNAKDFCISEGNFLNEKGICHETSCPNTPQQNGLAERKIGDIMDKSITLVVQANFPKNLWGFAAMTAIHLINEQLSKLLALKSPIGILEKLFMKVRLRNGLTHKCLGV